MVSTAWTRIAEVDSATRPGTRYRIAYDAEGRLGCSCPAWVYARRRRPCKHIVAVLGALAHRAISAGAGR